VRSSPAEQLRVDGALLLRALDADAGHAAALVELVRLQLVIQLACRVAFPAEANQAVASRRRCTVDERCRYTSVSAYTRRCRTAASVSAISRVSRQVLSSGQDGKECADHCLDPTA